MVDLGGQPVEQPIARQRLVAQRRTLDLRGLDRVPVHSVAERLHVRTGRGRVDPGRRRPAPTRPLLRRERAECGRRERYGLAERSVNGGFGSGHAPPSWPAALTPRLAATRRGAAPVQPSYSKPILTSTRYSTISPSRTTAVDFTTSTGHDVAHGLRRGGDGLAGGVAPRFGARADHLADDDDAHGCLLLTLDWPPIMTRGRPVSGPASWLLRRFEVESAARRSPTRRSASLPGPCRSRSCNRRVDRSVARTARRPDPRRPRRSRHGTRVGPRSSERAWRPPGTTGSAGGRWSTPCWQRRPARRPRS